LVALPLIRLHAFCRRRRLISRLLLLPPPTPL
jgi:hypothetical protein